MSLEIITKRINVPELKARKKGRPIVALTAYTTPMARLLDPHVDLLLVGDSLGMVVLGDENPLSVTVDDIIHHSRAVARGRVRALVVADMPFMSYQLSPEQAAENAGRLIAEGRAESVKLEGGVDFVPQIKAVVKCGIPVMGHIGLTPQSIHQLGGFKVQGKEEEAAKKLLEDAKAIEKAGVFSIVLEAIPRGLAARVTESVSVPTIGIGAGADCDGQVLVTNDMLGSFDRFTPKFVKKYADLAQIIVDAARRYAQEVREGEFPAEEHTYS